MKAICNREELSSAFQIVSTVIPSRSPKPILLNVKLSASSEGTVLLATDLEIGIRCKVAGVNVSSPGEIVLSSARVGAILRESSDSELEIESDDTQISIRGQRSRFKLSSESPREFPDVPDFAEEKYHKVASTLLRTMVRRTVFATDVESTRYALNGLLLELEGNRISLVGTDGRRLAVTRGTGTEVGGHTTRDLTPVAPSKAMNLVDRILQADEAEVYIAVHPNKIVIRTDRVVISSRLVEGRFPRYQEVFPARAEATIAMNVGEVLHATRQAAIVTNEESRGVEFAFGDGKLVLNAQAAEVGQSQVELPIAFDGKPIKITFDPRYLVDMLRVLNEESTVTLDLIDHQNAAVFKTDDGYTYVVMPLTRER